LLWGLVRAKLLLVDLLVVLVLKGALGMFHLFDKVPYMDLETTPTVTDDTGAKTLANSMSPRPDCNGRRSGPGFGEQG